MKWGGVVLVILVVLSAAVVGKAPPTVVVTVRGATVTSTGTVYVEFPEQAATKGEVFTASVVDAGVTATAKPGILSSPWVHGLIYLLAGGVLVIVFQYVKAKFKLTGRLALTVVSALCAVSGIGLSSLLGGLNVMSAGGGAAFVLASALLLYKFFVKK
jgi:hypothetical protein